MTKFNKIAIAVATFMAGSTYAAEADFIQYDIYGQIGGAMETEEAANAPTPNGLIEDDFGLYSDTHVLADIDFKFNKNLSIDTSTLVDFDSEEDPQVTLKELTFNGDFKKFHFKAGRFANPLFMNAEDSYRDYDNLRFREDLLLSAKGTHLEALDGAMIGYKTKLNKMNAEFNFYGGVPTDISDINELPVSSDPNITIVAAESDFSFTLENILHNKKFGSFRTGITYQQSSPETNDDIDLNDYFLDLGYEHKIDNLTIQGEFVHRIVELDHDLDLDSDAFNVLLGYDFKSLTPYVSYSTLDIEGFEDKGETIEFGLNYTINKHFKVKAAYEMLTDLNGNDNDIISAGLAIKL